MTKRIYKFDNLKFLLILLVVVGHFIEPYVATLLPAKKLFIFIYSFHMPLFIFTTGLFLKDYKTYDKLPINKLLFYAILIIFIKVYVAALSLIFGMNAGFSLFSGSGVYWYLGAVITYTLLIPLINRFNIKILIFLSFLLAIVAGYDNSIGDFLYLSRTIVYFPFFLLGYYYSTNRARLLEITSNKTLKAISLAIIIIIIGICYFRTNDIYNLRMLFTGKNSFDVVTKYYGYNCTYIHRILADIIALLAGFSVMCLVPNKQIRYITDMGSRTLYVYVLHRMFMILIAGFGIASLLQKAIGNYYIYIIILLAFGVTILLSLKFVKKLFDLAYDLIFNEKEKSL